MDIPTDWTFSDASVAGGFDSHVREQLPWYDLATGAVAHVVRHYLPENGLIYDIGASTGNLGRTIGDVLESRGAELIAIEASADMAALYRGPGRLVCQDAIGYPFDSFDVAVCFLTMMFMPPAERITWLKDLATRIRPGGCIIVVDKFMRYRSPYIETVMRRLTLAGKVATGTDAGEIVAKELSLQGIQRPMLAQSFERAISPQPQPIFQFGEFTGYIIEQPE